MDREPFHWTVQLQDATGATKDVVFTTYWSPEWLGADAPEVIGAAAAAQHTALSAPPLRQKTEYQPISASLGVG